MLAAAVAAVLAAGRGRWSRPRALRSCGRGGDEIAVPHLLPGRRAGDDGSLKCPQLWFAWPAMLALAAFCDSARQPLRLCRVQRGDPLPPIRSADTGARAAPPITARLPRAAQGGGRPPGRQLTREDRQG